MIARSTRTTSLAAALFVASLLGCGSESQSIREPVGPVVAEQAPEAVVEEAAADVATVEEAPPAPAPEPRTAAPRAWEHETSDIPVDPRIHFGHFDNGLRWAWASNPEPKERCYVRLHVDAGSLAEEDAELGMAHFLEHMAFNGTENFAPGTLIEWFQEHGMAFGADTNAHTAFSETVYKLDLPENDAETIREGLRVLRDFADGMLITAAEVEAEKGVIDGEQRERDSANFRMMMAQLDIMFVGTHVGSRLPIGTKEVRDTFTAESVRAFYERWYRPENMTLVAVGDFGGLDPVPLFREAFGDMPVPEAPLVKEPLPGTAEKYAHYYAIYEQEIPQVFVSIDRLKAWEQEPVTVAEWTEDLPVSYARRMLNLRFSEIAKQESAPFMGASASRLAMFDVFDGEGLTVTCAPEKWKEAMARGEQELRRALEHGFQQAELDEVRAGALRGLDEAVEREATAPSRSLLRRILAAAENPTVPTNAETRRRIVRPAIEALTVEACHAALRAGWAEGELSITAAGNLDLGENAADQLRAVYEASTRVAVEGAEKIASSEFAYASDPANAGKITKREHVEDLDFHMLQFGNGVMLNVKRTEFRENAVSMAVSFGEGGLTLEPERSQVMSTVASAVMNGGGLAAHSVDDLRRLTAGKQVGVGFAMGQDRFVLRGNTTAEDLLLQCELASAALRAPGWREDGLVQMRRRLPMMYQRMKHSPTGPMQMEFLPALFSHDPRIGVPAEEKVAACGVEQVREWLTPLLADAPIEITIVGDIDVEETIAFVAQTFGTLPQRRDWNAHEERRNMPAPKAGLEQRHTIETQIPKSLVILAFPTTDGIEMLRRRTLQMLNRVVTDRIRIEVRERLGAAYSPRSRMQTSTIHPGNGMLMMQAMSDPDKVDTLVEACLGVAESLATDGVTDEEVNRLREPILNRRRDAKRTNRYWMQVLGRAQSDVNQLDNTRSGDAFYASVNAADLTPLAKEYLQKDRASTLVVSPGMEN